MRAPTGRFVALFVLPVAMVVAAVVGSTPHAGSAAETDVLPGTIVRDFSSLEARQSYLGSGEVESVAPPQASLLADRRSARVAGSVTVTYQGEVPDRVRSVVDAAVAAWDALVELNPGAPVEMTFRWTELDPRLLGQGGSVSRHRIDGTWYPAALANHILGVDANREMLPEIDMELNASLGDDWHYDPETPPPFRKYDLYSTVLHELGHGMGFLGSAEVQSDETVIIPVDRHDSYDELIRTDDGSPILDVPQSGHNSHLTSDALHIDIGGARPFPVYAPNRYLAGTSYSHFDISIRDGEPGHLMTPALGNGQASRTFDGPVLGVLEGLDWSLSVPPMPVEPLDPTVDANSVSVSWVEDLSGPFTPAHSVRLVVRSTSSVAAEVEVPGVAGRATLAGLQPDTDYTLELTSLNRTGRTGTEPATVQFRTATEGAPPASDPDPDPDVPQPSAPVDYRSIDDVPGDAPLAALIEADDYDVSVDPEILRLYGAFFNRDPDVAGGRYWLQVNRGTAGAGGDPRSALEIAGFFTGQDEFRNTYADIPSADSRAFIARVYQNVLARPGEQAGVAYWVDILDGTNRSGNNPDLQQGDRGTAVYWIAKGQELVNRKPYLPG